MDAPSDSGSEEGVFSVYGLQHALNATIRLPASSVAPAEKETKGDKYRAFVSNRHDSLAAKLDEAPEAFDLISEQRDDHDDIRADPSATAKINRKYFVASKKLAVAETEYNVFTEDIDELCNTPNMTRDEAQLWWDGKAWERRKRVEADLAARERKNPLLKPLLTNADLVMKATTTVRNLQEEVSALWKKVEQDSHEKIILRGQLAQAEYEKLAVQQQAHAEIEHLRERIDT